MAVRLEGSIKRWIGDSTDRKPSIGTAVDADRQVYTASDLVPGSSFLEADTGRIYRWTGEHWVAAQESESTLILGAILSVLGEIKELIELNG